MDILLKAVFCAIAVAVANADPRSKKMSFTPTGLDYDYLDRTRSPASKINPPNPVDQNEYPFVVYLRTAEYSHLCTGSLIDRRWVLTAAHCIIPGLDIYVVLGDFNRADTDGNEQTIQIKKAFVHPDYTASFTYDIALLKLASAADIRSDAVGTVAPLASAAFLKKVLNNEKTCKVLGMGVTNYNNAWFLSDFVQQQDVRFVSDEEALNRTYSTHPTVLNTEAIYTDDCNIGSTCPGDSGGPIVCLKGKNWVVVALTSYFKTIDGCMTGIKGNANVQSFNSWIETIIS